MEFILVSIFTAGILGFMFGGGLAYAAKVFHVDKNPMIDEVLKALPGANCGACGYAGCAGYAEAIVEQAEEINLCIPGGNSSIQQIGALLNRQSDEKIKQIAYLRCQGDPQTARIKGIYDGIIDCRAAILIGGGDKICEAGCLGLGTCVKACPFNAITLNSRGLPEIIETKCTGCGKCVEVCPRMALALIPKQNKVYLGCATIDKGKTVKEYCSKGCIACTLCVKKCPVQAITMVNNLPVIDFNKCISCGICVHICPTHSYIDRIKSRSKFFIGPKCTGCGECAQICPVKVISGEKNQKHVIDKTKCIGCGLCQPKCPVKAIGIMGALGYTNEG